MQAASSTAPRARPLSPAGLALLVFLAAETAFFGTMVMAYLYLRANETVNAWAEQSHSLLLPAANTVVLLLSTLTMWQGLRAIRQGGARSLQTWLLITLALGFVFVGGQAAEFSRSGMRPDDDAFGGVFFTLLGFHALHVLAGVLILAINVARSGAGDFSARSYAGVELGAWFWYYVAGVWVVLFAALYLL